MDMSLQGKKGEMIADAAGLIESSRRVRFIFYASRKRCEALEHS